MVLETAGKRAGKQTIKSAGKVAVGTKKKEGPGPRERIVSAAADLFYIEGYQAASLDSVARRAGVNRGSLYYFFKSKKNLGLAVIDHFERQIHQNFLQPVLQNERAGRGQLKRLADLYSEMPRAESPCCGCPIGKLSLELSGVDEDLRLSLKNVWGGVISVIETMVCQAREEGALPSSADTEGLARSFFAQIQGAHIIARSTLDAEALGRDCRRALEGLPWVN